VLFELTMASTVWAAPRDTSLVSGLCPSKVHDRLAGTTVLASRATGARGRVADELWGDRWDTPRPVWLEETALGQRSTSQQRSSGAESHAIRMGTHGRQGVMGSRKNQSHPGPNAPEG
jgi:hypothetical protein